MNQAARSPVVWRCSGRWTGQPSLISLNFKRYKVGTAMDGMFKEGNVSKSKQTQMAEDNGAGRGDLCAKASDWRSVAVVLRASAGTD
jgi:hypothetical protein